MANISRSVEQEKSKSGMSARRPADETPTDLVSYLKQYAEANPSAAALWCFGIGFVLGWKLKPW